MSRNRFRIIATSAALVVTLVALVLAIYLQPPTGPGGPNPTLYDCTVVLWLFELFTQANYYFCLLYCERRHPDDPNARARCQNNCLLTFILLQFLVILTYLACLLRAVFF